MAWTYDSALLDTSTALGRRYIVRLTIGDTDTLDQQLQDEEIDYFLQANGDIPRYASISSVRALIARYSRQADLWIGHTKISASDRVRQYRQLLESILESPESSVLDIFAGGQSKAGKADLDSNTDLPPPAFRIGQDDIDTQGTDFTVLP